MRQLSISRLSSLLRHFFISKIEGFMHVRITNVGRRILNDKDLANKVIDAIIDNKERLTHGEKVHVKGENFSVTLVTTLKEVKSEKAPNTHIKDE